MIHKAAFPGKYIQGAGVLGEIPNLIDSFANNPLIITSPTVVNEILPRFGKLILENNYPIDIFNGESTKKEIARINQLVKDKNYDIVIGIGGGKLIDTVKVVADNNNLRVIIVPTIASTDAPCSGLSVIYTEDRIVDSVHYNKQNPDVVLVDLNVIANSPVRYLVAGMGDALATWFEARSCERTKSMNECGGYSTLTGIKLSKLCYDTLLGYGLLAKIANENNVISEALNYIVEANILLSGIGFESSGLAAAHAIHNGLTTLPQTQNYYHGEKVAFGVLASLHLTNANPQEINEVYSFCRQVGLPTKLEDIGLRDYSHSDIELVAKKTLELGKFIHHEAGVITEQKIFDSIIIADAYGKKQVFDF